MSEHKYKEQKKSKSLWEEPLSKFLIWGSIGGIVLLVYLNALGNSFVWDDIVSIKESPLLHSYAYLPKLFGEVMNLIYRPLTYSTFIVIYQTFGGSPLFYHMLSVVVHIFSCVLFFYILRRFYTDRVCLLLTLLFAVHPMNVEAVSWASAYSEVSYVMYGLISFVFALRFIEGGNKWINLSLMSMFIFLSYLSKESAFVISGIILFYIFIFDKKKIIYSFVFQVVPLITYLALRFLILKSEVTEILEKSIVPIQSASLGERILQIPAIIFYYFKTIFIPFPLKTQQNWMVKEIDFVHFVFPIACIVGICTVLVFLGVYIKNRWTHFFQNYIFFCGWVVIWMLFHIQILPLTMTVAERWGYLAILGVLGLLGVLGEIIIKHRKYLYWLVGIYVVTIISFSLITIYRNNNWRNNFTLYSADYRKEDNNAFLENGVGAEYLNKEMYDDAYPYLIRATQLSPKGWKNWSNLGIYYQKKGKPNDAETAYRTAIVNKKNFLPPYEKLSFLLFSQDRLDEAEKVILAGLKQNSNNIELIRVYALVLYTKGDKEKAIELMEIVATNNPLEQNKLLLKDMRDNYK